MEEPVYFSYTTYQTQNVGFPIDKIKSLSALRIEKQSMRGPWSSA
jgi:hypothetical protein